MATALVDQDPVTPVSVPRQSVAPNADFDARWAAWLEVGASMTNAYGAVS